MTTLDVTRASTFLSGIAGSKPSETIVPVVGGHSGVTIVPLLSQAGPAASSVKPGEQYDKLVHRIQFGGDEVVKAKDGAGSATLSMAYAAAVFTNSLLRALGGEKGVKECAYVESPLYKDQGAEFFASPVTLGANGVEEIHPVGKVSKEEEKLLEAAVPELAKSESNRTESSRVHADVSFSLRHQEGCRVGCCQPLSDCSSLVENVPCSSLSRTKENLQKHTLVENSRLLLHCYSLSLSVM